MLVPVGHKTVAWPLAQVYAALIVFASLFPFVGWRAQGIAPEVFLWARLPPPYWTRFDVAINVVGYAPLGFLLALALLRTGWPRSALPLAALGGALLSLLMEFLQIYLPQRVPSNLDLLLNAGGALAGALLATLMERLGAIDRWGALSGALVCARCAWRFGAAGVVALGLVVSSSRAVRAGPSVGAPRSSIGAIVRRFGFP